MRVLVTEDEPTMARLVSQGLVEDGHEVEIVATGERAVDAVRETVYDLVLLDVMLPGLDGFAACRKIRDRGATMPVLMLTARDAVADEPGDQQRAGEGDGELAEQLVQRFVTVAAARVELGTVAAGDVLDAAVQRVLHAPVDERTGEGEQHGHRAQEAGGDADGDRPSVQQPAHVIRRR